MPVARVLWCRGCVQDQAPRGAIRFRHIRPINPAITIKVGPQPPSHRAMTPPRPNEANAPASSVYDTTTDPARISVKAELDSLRGSDRDLSTRGVEPDSGRIVQLQVAATEAERSERSAGATGGSRNEQGNSCRVEMHDLIEAGGVPREPLEPFEHVDEQIGDDPRNQPEEHRVRQPGRQVLQLGGRLCPQSAQPYQAADQDRQGQHLGDERQGLTEDHRSDRSEPPG